MEPRKTIYYSDPIHDDFAASHGKINTRVIPSDYSYIRYDPIWYMASFLFYRFIATPAALVYCKLLFGLKIRNKKALRGIKGGYFLYGNHTQDAADAFIPSLLSFPRSCGIIAGPDAFSIPVVRRLVELLHAVPVASTLSGNIRLLQYLKYRVKFGGCVAIYPEAHIWPFYNGIRPYPAASFSWPVILKVPCVGFTVTYRERRFLKKLPPLITVTVSEPIYPDENTGKAELRNAVYDFMCKTVESEHSAEYIRYQKIDAEIEYRDGETCAE